MNKKEKYYGYTHEIKMKEFLKMQNAQYAIVSRIQKLLA